MSIRKFTLLNMALILIILLAACGAQSTEVSPQSAVLSELQGAVAARQAQAENFSPASNGFVLDPDGQVQTGDDGKARLDLSTGTIVRVAPSSLFTLVSNTPADGGLSTKISISLGQIWIILNGGEMEVQTPSGEASVRGSYMGITSLIADETYPFGLIQITCLEGDCSFENETGAYQIPPGSVLEGSGSNVRPLIKPMSLADVQGWLDVNPEAAQVLPALTAGAVTATTEATATSTSTPIPPTPTPSPLPTFSVLTGVVTADSLSCRYGPGANYLFEYSFIKGNKVEVLGRADTTVGTWLYVKFGNTLKPCWVNARFIELSGDASGLEPVYPEKAALIRFQGAKFPPPADVTASRNGDQVEIFWRGYELTLGDRESADSPLYLVEAWTCQEGKIVFTPIGAFTESALIKDEAGCSEPSHGQVFVAHKDGYVGPVEIPWPAP